MFWLSVSIPLRFQDIDNFSIIYLNEIEMRQCILSPIFAGKNKPLKSNLRQF